MLTKEQESELMTAGIQEIAFLISGKRPLFTTDFRLAVQDLADAVQEKKPSLSAIKTAQAQIDWDKIEKVASIAHNLVALKVPEELYTSQTSEAIYVCLSGLLPNEYASALKETFSLEEPKRKAFDLHTFAAGLDVLAAVMNASAAFGAPVAHDLANDINAKLNQEQTAICYGCNAEQVHKNDSGI